MRRRLAWLAGMWLSCVCLAPKAAEELDAYWRLDQYLAAHPEQAQDTETLKRLVRNAPQPAHLQQDQPVRIALISPGGQASDYWRRNRLALERRLTMLGLNYQLQAYDQAPEQDERQQTRQLVDALAADPDYLIYTLDTQAQRKYIARLLNRPRPKLILQNITTPLKDWETRPPLLYVGFDHQRGSRLLADYFRRQAANRAHFDYAMLYRHPGYVSTSRGETFINQMQMQPNSRLQLSLTPIRIGHRPGGRPCRPWSNTLSWICCLPVPPTRPWGPWMPSSRRGCWAGYWSTAGAVALRSWRPWPVASWRPL